MVAAEPAQRESAPSSETHRVPRAVWRGTALQATGRLWGVLCTFVTLGLLARHLSGEDFGRFTFYLAVLVLVDTASDFGTSVVALQRGSHDRWALTAVLLAGRRLRLVAAGCGFALVVDSALLLREQGLAWIALAFLAPLTRVAELSSVVYQSRLAWGTPVLMRALGAGWRLLFVLLCVHAEVSGYGPYLVIHASGMALANLLLGWAARRELPRRTIPVAPLAGLFALAWPFAVAGLCQQAYFYLDNLFVRAFEGEVELGRYNAAVRILTFLLMISSYATAAALPWLARRRRAGDLGRATRALAIPLATFGTLATAALWPLAETLLSTLFGNEFATAAPSLRWLLLAAAIVYLGSSFFTAVVALEKPRAVLGLALGGLLINAAGNAILVPARGIEGAAMATAITELWIALAAAWVLWRVSRRFPRVSTPCG